MAYYKDSEYNNINNKLKLKLLVTQGDLPITTTRVGYSDVG